MKRIFSAIVSMAMLGLFIFTGCSSSSGPEPALERDSMAAAGETGAAVEPALSVVTTIFPQYDFVRRIAGERVELSMLIPPGAESHSFEPTPQDILTVQNCDVFIYVGGESDDWVARILDSMDTSDMTIVALLDLVDAVEEEIVEGMTVEDGHGDDEDDGDRDDEDDHEVELDEHVWTSPKNAMVIARDLCEYLAGLDEDYRTEYEAATAAYIEELEEVDAALEEVVENAARTTVVFGDRFPFRYLAKDYGLDYFAAFPGCSTETEPSAATIAFLIDKVEDEEIPVVFHIEFSTEKIADTIAEATGAQKLQMHSCHNLAKDDFESGVTYLELMWQNVDVLKEALG